MESLSLRRRINPVYLAFMTVTFMVGIAGALQAPTLSLFLSREVDVRPFWVGLFYTVNALAGIVVSMLLAKRSDSRGDRRMLILFCCLIAAGNAVLFAFNRHYLTLVTLGVALSAIASVAMPQIFALAREYADNSAREAVMFSSVMRAQMSLAWVIGPPLSFTLVLNFGFTTMYMLAAALFLFCILLIWLTLPSMSKPSSLTAAPLAPIGGLRNVDVRMLFIASVLMWACNSMYIIDIPLYISSSLGLSDSLAGLLMGTAAGLEIPVMLLAGRYVRRTGMRNMMLIAVACGAIFYLGMVLFQSRAALMALQLFNAVFIGIIAGIGMIWFQDLMPGRPGAATTLFTNSISTGVILAGLLQGTMAENFGHVAVYWLAFAMALVSLGLSWRIREGRRL